jgi:hypothetical protein
LRDRSSKVIEQSFGALDQHSLDRCCFLRAQRFQFCLETLDLGIELGRSLGADLILQSASRKRLCDPCRPWAAESAQRPIDAVLDPVDQSDTVSRDQGFKLIPGAVNKLELIPKLGAAAANLAGLPFSAINPSRERYQLRSGRRCAVAWEDSERAHFFVPFSSKVVED